MSSAFMLLVEDNPDDEALTLHALEKNNIRNEIVVKRDGAEALEFVFESCLRGGLQLPVMMLLDLKLPKVDGLTVLRRLREDERTRLLPIVVLTSSNEQRDVVESYRLGANSYVRKPVDFVEFSEAVGRLGLYWLLTNQAPPA